MEIRPRSTGSASHAGAERLDESRGVVTPRPTADPTTPATPSTTDRVELSGEALALERSQGAERSGGFELSADRMRSITQRLASGHYDRPEVQAAVVSRLAADPEAGILES